MITKEHCADWINSNLYKELTEQEVETLKNSIKNFPAKQGLCESLIEVFGDVTMLVEIRDED